MRYVIAIWLLLLLCASAFAEDAPDVCVQNDRHLVVGRHFDDRPGTKFLVFHKSRGQDLECLFEPERADWIVSPDDDPFTLIGLDGDHLVLSYDMGGFRGVVAYNLDKQSLELDQDAAEWQLVPGGIWFWQPWSLPNAGSCPGIAEPAYQLHRYFDFSTNAINDVDSADSRCVAR